VTAGDTAGRLLLKPLSALRFERVVDFDFEISNGALEFV
jgi:hypothetical protein